MQTKLAMWKALALWWRVRSNMERGALAFRYATGRATQNDGMRLLCDGERLAGHYALISISVEALQDDVADLYEPHPALERLCEQAVERVANKWGGDSSGETTGAALDWAMGLVRDYARADGVELVELGESTCAEVKHAHATEAAEGLCRLAARQANDAED